MNNEMSKDDERAATWRGAFDERHQFDVYPEHFMAGLRNEFSAGWHAALKVARAAAPQADESELAKKDRTIAFLRDQNRRIIAAADRIRDDVDRYRWLRERAWYVDAATYALELRERWRDGDMPPPDADDIEQALDGARKAESKHVDSTSQTDTKS